MRWYVGVAAMLLGSVAHPADTDNPFIEGTPAFESGNKLYDECKGSSAGFNTGFCYGYIVGVADVAAALKAIDFCPPKGMTVEQTVDTVKKFLTDHPESRHYSGYSEVIVALRLAYPCAKQPPATK